MSEKQTVKSACRMCHGACQVIVHLEGDRVVKVSGDPDSPVSRGHICPKGIASPELLYHPDRITHPLRRVGKRGENQWKQITWDEALGESAERLQTIKRESGPEYFAMLHGTSRPYTDFAGRFANAFGTPNFTHIGHICYVPRVMASIFTVGSQQLPAVDVYGFGGRMPECILVWGCNTMEIGVAQGVVGSIVTKALKRAARTIVVDPRKTRAAENANHWLQIRPGTDGALALAMIHVVIKEDLVDHEFIEAHTEGFELLKQHVRPFTPAWAERTTRIGQKDIIAAATDYARSSPAGILWGSAIDQSVCSFQTARSLLILSAITGNIDRPGGDIIHVTPDRVNMKSQLVNREMSGMLHLPLDKYSRILDSKKRPSKGLRQQSALLLFRLLDWVKKRHYEKLARKSAKGVVGKQIKLMNKLKGSRYPILPMLHLPTLVDSILSGDPYRIRALWILGSNPLLTQTDPLRLEKALGMLEFLVVSDFFLTPTAQCADLVLPASTWLEQDDVVNSLKQWCVIARRKVARVGESMDDREIMLRLARKLGLEQAFPWKDYRDFTKWMLEDTGLTFEQFCEEGILAADMKYRKHEEDGFNTPSGKLEIYSELLEQMGVSPLPVYREPAVSPVSTPDLAERFPLILTTGKSRTFFHSEGRQIPSLRKKNPDPVIEIHPETAGSLGIGDGTEVWIENHHGKIRMKARLFDGIAPDVVSAQHGWWFPEEDAPEYGWKKSNLNLLFGKPEFDPDIGSESLRTNLCKVYPVEPA